MATRREFGVGIFAAVAGWIVQPFIKRRQRKVEGDKLPMFAERSERDLGIWHSADKKRPFCFPMRLYGNQPIVVRSYNVLCKNEGQVFLGFAVSLDNRLVSKHVQWYQSSDYSMRYPMAVDEFQIIDADPRLLHSQWVTVEEWPGPQDPAENIRPVKLGRKLTKEEREKIYKRISLLLAKI